MLGWRRKNEGFEWRDYVRTTVKLKREERAKKIDEIKQAAASGAKDVGRQSVAAGRNGASALARWIRDALISLWSLLVASLRLAGAGARDLLRGLRRRSSGSSQHSGGAGIRGALSSTRLSARAKIGILFSALAFAAALSAYLQYAQSGARWSTNLAGAVALVLMGLAIAPWLSRLQWPTLHGIRAIRRDIAQCLSWPSGAMGKSIGALGAVTIVAGAGFWGWQSGEISSASSAVSSLVPFSSRLPDIQGRARAVSGDTVKFGGRTVRLAGIEAPEISQVCQDKKGRAWRCGRRARDVLARTLRRETAICTGVSEVRGGVLEATCRVKGGDVAEQLVETGYAFAQGTFLKTYADAEEKARAAGRGIWQGDALRPADYRAQRWAAASKSAPGGCPIKGQVVRKAKVYVLPWASDYRQIRVRRQRGERWFCSEAEATNAGFQASPAGS